MEVFSALALLQFIPAAVGVMLYARLDRAMRVLTWLFVVGAVAEVANKVMIAMVSNNMPVIYVYTIAEVWLLMMFVKQLWHPAAWHGIKYTILEDKIIAIIVTAITLTEFTISPWSLGACSRVSVCVVAVWYLVFIVRLVAEGYRMEWSKFVIIGLMLIYYISTGVFFALIRWLSEEAGVFAVNIVLTINAVLNVLYPVFIWKSTRSSSLA